MNQRLGQREDIDRVREATDLVHLIGERVTLRPRGREHVGLCPFHDDHSPSMAVVTHKGNAFFKCHACGAGGDAFDFVQQYHKLEFPEALKYLAERAGIELQPLRREQSSESSGQVSRADLREANALASSFFSHVLRSDTAGKHGRSLLAKRNISDEMIETFMLGLAPDQWDGLLKVIERREMSKDVFLAAGLLKQRKSSDGWYDAFRNRLIFPICNELGQPVAFGARKIEPEDEPKYLNSAESPLFQKSRTLYGLYQARRSIIDQRTAIVTEGYTDVIACHQAGITNVVGTLGTALTRDHARILSKLCDTVVLVFDGDEAGQRAADRGLEVFFAEPVDVRICVLPDNLDPDDLLHSEGGTKRFRAAIAQATDALRYKVQRFQDAIASITGLSARQKHLESFLRELADLGFREMEGVRKRWVLSHLADLLDLSVHDLERSMPQGRARVNHTADHESHDESEAPQHELPQEGDLVGAMNPVTASRARVRAERDLLSLLIYDPSLSHQLVSVGEFHNVPITSVVKPEQFQQESMHQIAMFVLALIERDEHFTVQELRDSLSDESARSLALTLYFEGQQQVEGHEQQRGELLQSACVGFVDHLAHEEYERLVADYQQRKPQGDDALQAMNNLLELRRNRTKKVAGAIMRGIRS